MLISSEIEQLIHLSNFIFCISEYKLLFDGTQGHVLRVNIQLKSKINLIHLSVYLTFRRLKDNGIAQLLRITILNLNSSRYASKFL